MNGHGNKLVFHALFEIQQLRVRENVLLAAAKRRGEDG